MTSVNYKNRSKWLLSTRHKAACLGHDFSNIELNEHWATCHTAVCFGHGVSNVELNERWATCHKAACFLHDFRNVELSEHWATCHKAACFGHGLSNVELNEHWAIMPRLGLDVGGNFNSHIWVCSGDFIVRNRWTDNITVHQCIRQKLEMRS